MINSKDRSKLLALANGINTTVYIGKYGLTEAVLAQIDEMLNDHELIKIGVQKNADFGAKEIINPICDELNAEPVHAIGNKVIIYRYSSKEGIEHIDYKGNSTKTEEKKTETKVKPKILGRKTFEYKTTKPQSDKYSSGKNTSYGSSGVAKKTYGNTNGKSSASSNRNGSSSAPYKKDGVTIYKHKAGKPASAKKSNKK